MEDNLRDHADYLAWLRDEGANVEGVGDYPDALLAWGREQRDVVIADNVLPSSGYLAGSDGIELLLLLDRLGLDPASQQQVPEVSVGRVLITAHGVAADFQMDLQERGVVILRKPLTADALVRAVLLACEHAAAPLWNDRGSFEALYRVRSNGPVAVDTWTGCVTVNDSEVKLPPKPHGVLVWRLVNIGRVVSEEELLEVVWRTHHADDSSAARNAISTLRTLLGLPGDSFIETRPGGWCIPRFP